MKVLLGKTAIWLLITIATAVAAFGVGQDASKTDAPAPDGKKILESNCLACHGLDQIESQAMNKDDWKTVVDMMVDYGASLKENEVPVLVEYLAATYPPK